MDFKIGDWVTCDDNTFVICKIADAPVSGTTYSEESYFSMWHEWFITYHCRKATQEEIEKACADMLAR